MTSSRTHLLCLLLVTFVAVGGAFVIEPGPFSIDEVTYQLMVQSLIQGSGLTVWNGYENLPSVELTSSLIRESEGHLYGQYPYLYILAAAPFHALLGFRGLFVLNALSFVGCTCFCYQLTNRWLQCRSSSLLAGGLFCVASFSPDYALAAWPHMFATFLLLATVWFAVTGNDATDRHKESTLAFASGASVAMGLGVRLDVAICAAPLLLLFVGQIKIRWRFLFFGAVGASIPLAIIMGINWLRWGDFSPLSYGRSHSPQLTPGLIALGLSFAGLVTWRKLPPPLRTKLPRWGRWLFPLMFALCLLVAPFRQVALNVARGLTTLLFDLSILDLERHEPAMSRTASGAVVYAGTLKKSLFQSFPYFGILGAAIISCLRRQPVRKELLVVAAIPTVLILFYSRTSWHGGMSFNLRYFTLIVPFLTMFCVALWRDVARGAIKSHQRWGLATFCGVSTLLWCFIPWGATAESLEPWLLTAPLLLAAMTAVVTAGANLLHHTRCVAMSSTLLLASGVAWSAMVCLCHDLPRSHALRTRNYQLGQWVADYMPDRSLLFVEVPDEFYSVRDSLPNTTVALPRLDKFNSMLPLTNYYLGQNSEVYAAFSQTLWSQLAAVPELQRYVTKTISVRKPFVLKRIHHRSNSAAPTNGQRPLVNTTGGRGELTKD